jgi:hypothetical protein
LGAAGLSAAGLVAGAGDLALIVFFLMAVMCVLKR